MNTRNIFRTLVITTNLGYVLSTLLLFYLYDGQFNAAYAALPEKIDYENQFINAISLTDPQKYSNNIMRLPS